MRHQGKTRTGPSQMATEPVTGWWEEPGPDACEFCGHAFRIEVGFHCVECDRPVCSFCVLTVDEEQLLFCPACHPEKD